MRTDKDRSGVALWVIPVCLVVVFIVLVDHRLRGIWTDPFACADPRNGRGRSHYGQRT